MAVKSGMMVLGVLAVVIAGGAMTTEPREIRSRELEFGGDRHISCLGEYSHPFGSLAGPMLRLKYEYKLTVHPDGDLVVHRKTPSMADWIRCIGYSH